MFYINKACFLVILCKIRQDASLQNEIPRKRAWDTRFFILIQTSITFHLISLEDEFLITRSQCAQSP